MHFLKNLHLIVVLSVVFVVTVGYGISFPLLAIRLEAMQVSSSLIGLNAAVPALGWFILTPFLPKLHQHFSSKTLMLSFLAIALLGLFGFTLSDDFTLWLVCRLAFGGGLGMFFRVVEYWLTTITITRNRGRIIGVYSTCFLVGIAVGSLLQPELGSSGKIAFSYIAGFTLVGGILLALAPIKTSLTQNGTPTFKFLGNVIVAAPLSMAGVIAYGLFEDVPANLLSIYSLKIGLGEDIAAYTLSAFVLGNLFLAIPLGMLSDKIGRVPVMIVCASVGLLGSVVIPTSTGSVSIYLTFLLIWGGFIGGLYSAGLAYIGDHFAGDDLIMANAAFGTIYAAAAIVGPMLNGMAMQLWEPNGLMVACAMIFGGFLLFAMVNQRIGGRDAAKANS